MGRLLAHFLVPFSGNNHHPHAVRPAFLSLYLLAIFAVQLVYNYQVTGEARVLSFATDINQIEVIKLTNFQRTSAGQAALKESTTLAQVAKLKAEDMFKNDYWAHTSPSGVTPWHFYDQVGYSYIYAGENLARDFDTSSGVVEGWMNSSSHKANLLSGNYSEIGVAVVNGVLLGHETTLVVQEFGHPKALVAAAPKPPPVKSVPSPTSAVAATEPTLVPEPLALVPVLTAPLPEENISVNPSVLSLDSLSSGQKLLLAMLAVITTFFFFDGIVLWRRHDISWRGHSLLHTSVLGVVLVLIATASQGVLR